MVTSPASRLARPKSIRNGRSVLGHHDVRRLDVAVDHALLVGVLQSVGEAGDQLGRLAEARPAGGQQVGQRHALDEVADEVGGAVVLADLVDRDDRRMAQLGGAAGLAQESIQLLAARRPAGAGDLEGDDAIQLRVAGLEDRAEGARSDLGSSSKRPTVRPSAPLNAVVEPAGAAATAEPQRGK